MNVDYSHVGLVAGIALLVSLATLVWCAILIPRLKYSPDRLLVGAVGFLCFLHIAKLLHETGLWPLPLPASLTAIHGLVVALLFLGMVFILGAYRAQHRRVEYRLRLAEANEAPPPVAPARPAPVLSRD